MFQVRRKDCKNFFALFPANFFFLKRNRSQNHTSYESKALKDELKIQKCLFKSTSYVFKSMIYEFRSMSYKFKSTSFEFKSTNIKSMKTQVNSLKTSSFPKIINLTAIQSFLSSSRLSSELYLGEW